MKKKTTTAAAKNSIQRVAHKVSRKYVEQREDFVKYLASLSPLDKDPVKLAAAYRKEDSDHCNLLEWIRVGDFKNIGLQASRMAAFIKKHKIPVGE